MERRRKAIGVLTRFRACWLMAVCIWLENQGVKGQAVLLGAFGTGQTIPPYIETFGNGQPTAYVTGYLPVCFVFGGSGPFIRLEKTDGSLVLVERGAFSGVTSAQVNSTVHPILNTSHTGLYHCRTVDHNSTQIYQLNIVAEQIQSGPFPTSQNLIYTGATYNIPCISSGNFPLNSSWNSTLTLDTQMIQTVTPRNMVNSTFSFQQNDSQIVFTESDTSGVTFNVICTTSYTTHFDCYGMGSNPPRPQSVIDTCVNASKSKSSTVSVTIQALCPNLNDSGFNYKPIPGFSRQPAGAPVPIECRTGFLSNNSMDITQSTCQGNGMWHPSPPLCESCSMVCNNPSVTSCARITVSNIPGINCPCNGTDEIWTSSAQDCVPTHCPAQEGNSPFVDIPKLEVNNSTYVACNNTYTSTDKGRNVTCMPNGTLSNLPNCTDQGEKTMMTNISVNYTTSFRPPETYVNYATPLRPSDTYGETGIGTGAIILIGGIGGLLVAALIVAVLVLIIRSKKPSEPAETVPNLTENAAYGDAGFAESVLTKSDAYGVVQPAEDSHYSYVDFHQ
ncbi:uncharacterized protein LOC135811929 isoform X2 [Sycon ciliatum]|uniref:uncharacterized protein LOC135811929 isoform X2 n=1 Tax=Sycon ciliatum TaxID=27933 RepID=UPI0031F71DE0